MKRALISLLVLWVMFGQVRAFAQVTAVPQRMNFQGRLARPDGTPIADGTYAIRFSLHTAVSGGSEVWNQPLGSVAVQNGTFSVQLSGFPANTFHSNQWLEIKIGADPPLSPRQLLVTVPYAFKADMALTVPDRSITNAKIANGTLTADKFAADIFNPIAWLLGGNSGTNPANHFLGTIDNQPLHFRVNNQRVLRFERVQYNNLLGVNVLAGWEGNSITEGVTTATIAGGGEIVTNLNQSVPNRVTDIGGTVGGGAGNTAGSADATLNNATFATVSGGLNNTANGTLATVGGGQDNTAGGAATVSGGIYNTASGAYAAVGGGRDNTASGESATVSGGRNNTAVGSHSFAAGRRARANHDGAFVWGDSTDADFASTSINQFLIRAGGGVGINKNDPAAALDIAGSAFMTGFRLSSSPSLGSVLLSNTAGDGSWGQVSSAGLADNAVTSVKILDGAVAAVDLASNAVTSAKIADNAVTNAKIQSVDWSKLTNVPSFPYWGLSGNAGTNPASHFLGTTDNQPLVFKTNNLQALMMGFQRSDSTGIFEGINVMSGPYNSIAGLSIGGTIFGGTYYNSAVQGNSIEVGTNVVMVGGTIGGGQRNRIVLPDFQPNGTRYYYGATIAGGQSNRVTEAWTTIGGGVGNIVEGKEGTIAGGTENTAGGQLAAVPGGYRNAALGDYSFAAGRRAKANHDGAFVWADSTIADFASTAINQFLIRAQNGVGINASSLRGDLDLRSASGNANFYMQAAGAASGMNFGVSSTGNLFIAHYNGTSYTDRIYLNSAGNVGIGTTAPGYKLHVTGNIGATGFVNTSDGRYKTNIAAFPDALDAILNLRGVTFDWKQADYPGMNFSEGRQIGFIAQEVEQILPELVATDQNGYKSVAYANVVPVLVEAVKTQQKQIKTLTQDNDGKQKQIDDLKGKNAEMEARLNTLAEAVERLQNRQK